MTDFAGRGRVSFALPPPPLPAVSSAAWAPAAARPLDELGEELEREVSELEARLAACEAERLRLAAELAEVRLRCADLEELAATQLEQAFEHSAAAEEARARSEVLQQQLGHAVAELEDFRQRYFAASQTLEQARFEDAALRSRLQHVTAAAVHLEAERGRLAQSLAYEEKLRAEVVVAARRRAAELHRTTRQRCEATLIKEREQWEEHRNELTKKHARVDESLHKTRAELAKHVEEKEVLSQKLQAGRGAKARAKIAGLTTLVESLQILLSDLYRNFEKQTVVFADFVSGVQKLLPEDAWAAAAVESAESLGPAAEAVERHLNGLARMPFFREQAEQAAAAAAQAAAQAAAAAAAAEGLDPAVAAAIAAAGADGPRQGPRALPPAAAAGTVAGAAPGARGAPLNAFSAAGATSGIAGAAMGLAAAASGFAGTAPPVVSQPALPERGRAPAAQSMLPLPFEGVGSTTDSGGDLADPFADDVSAGGSVPPLPTRTGALAPAAVAGGRPRSPVRPGPDPTSPSSGGASPVPVPDGRSSWFAADRLPELPMEGAASTASGIRGRSSSSTSLGRPGALQVSAASSSQDLAAPTSPSSRRARRLFSRGGGGAATDAAGPAAAPPTPSAARIKE